MKAMVYRSYGGPESLELAEVDEPKIGPDWVSVAVRAASVNPVDWKLAAGGMEQALDVVFPVIPGWDVAGVVAAVGPAVTTLAPGDEVYGYVRKDYVHGGTYAERVSAPIRTLARKPSTLSFAEAAAVPLAALTAYQVLVHHLRITPGEEVLIHAAAGGVGSYAVQIARALGARVIGTASPNNHDYLRKLGAEPFGYGADLAGRVRTRLPEGVDAVFDLVGGDTMAQSPELLSDSSFGRIASIADTAVKDLGGHYAFVHPDVADLDALTELIDGGKVAVEVAASYRLEHAARAWADSMGGHTRGKIVLTVD